MKLNSVLRAAPWSAACLALLTAHPAHADYPATVSALGPVAYYRLDTTNQVPAEVPAANAGSLGASFAGEYQGMAGTRGLPGALAGDASTAVSIVGSAGQQVVVPFSAAHNPNGPFSVELWAKPANTINGRRAVAIAMVNGQNLGNGDDRSGWALNQSGSNWEVLLGYDRSDGTTFYGTVMSAPGAVTEGAWQHVVLVYSGDSVSLFVNGVQVASQAPGKPMLPNTGAPLILGDRGYTGWDYNGELDEFALYTTALSAADIKAHYDNGVNAARTKPYADLVKERNPALYLRLDEASLALPVAVNSGSWGTAANGQFLAGTVPGVPGLQSPATVGFDTNNRAGSFDGLKGAVTVPAQTLETDAATLVAWVKRSGDQPGRAGIVYNRGTGSPATGLGFHDDGRALSYSWDDLAETYNFNPGFVVPDQAWTFVAMTVQADQAVLYMGTATGLVAATNTFAHPAHNFANATLEFGRDNNGGTRYLRGALDEFALFDKTLDPAQIRSLYNAALPAILGLTRTPADPIYEGFDVTFRAAVSGTGTTYQWQKAGQDLPGKTAATLELKGVVPADGGDYRVVAKTGGQTLTSAASSFAVVSSAPILSQSPSSAVRFVNGSVTFSVAALGSQPMTYAWKHGSDLIPGATSSTLTLPDLQLSDAGTYTVVVTNPLGSKEASATLDLVTPSKFEAAAVNAGPIGYWRLDEASGTTAYDYWNGRDGTSRTGVTNGVAGPVPTAFKGFEAGNKAYDFNGGSEVTIPAFNSPKTALTIVAWIKPDGTPDAYDGIVFSRGGNTVAGLDFQNDGQLGYHWNDTADTYGWASGMTPVIGQWNFVALVVEPALGKIYLDDGSGLQSSENAVTHAAEEFNGPFRFGADGNGSRFFKGTLDDVVIYDRALSAVEITALRDAGIAGTFVPATATVVEQPKSATILAGNSYTLTAKVAGSVPLSFQWKKNGEVIPGAIRSSLSFPAAVETNSGTYQLVVTQGATVVNSQPATLTVKPVPAYVNLPESLVAHLKFDGDYADASGRNNAGTAKGTPQLITGKVGTGAVRVTTTVSGGAVTAANYVSLGVPTDLQFGAAQNFSVAFWTRFTGLPGDLPFLSSTTCSLGCDGFNFSPGYNEGGWGYSLNGDGPQDAYVTGSQNRHNDGEWHHLVFTVNRTGSVIVYVDGLKVDERPAGDYGDLTQPQEVLIGQANNGDYADPGTLEIDDLGIWRRELAGFEAQSIYIVGQQHGRSFDQSAPVVTDPQLKIAVSGGNLEITWTGGTLESVDALGGAWAPVAGASAPKHTVTAGDGAKFYRVSF